MMSGRRCPHAHSLFKELHSHSQSSDPWHLIVRRDALSHSGHHLHLLTFALALLMVGFNRRKIVATFTHTCYDTRVIFDDSTQCSPIYNTWPIQIHLPRYTSAKSCVNELVLLRRECRITQSGVSPPLMHARSHLLHVAPFIHARSHEE